MAKPTLLIVEDNHAQQHVFKHLCERFGYDACIVGSAEKALTALSQAQYAAVILDINLPGMSGLDMVHALRTLEEGRVRGTPVLAVTASNSKEFKDECLAAGIDDYLSKPFSIDAFRKLLLRWTYDARHPNLELITSVTNDEKMLG